MDWDAPRLSRSFRRALLIVLIAIVLFPFSRLPGDVAMAENSNVTTPSVGYWSPLSQTNAPSPRADATAVWIGTEMLVWGGLGNPGTGGAYDPATNTWRALPAAGALSPREHATAVWTGSEMLIWGGAGPDGWLGDGAAYKPQTNTWRTLPNEGAPSQRAAHTAVWTGSEMIIWGGQGPSWRGDGAAYNPQTNRWTPLSTTGAPSPRYDHTAVWTSAEMLIWGGESGATDHNDGAAYNPTTNTWRSLPTEGAPSARANHAGVWTGNTMLIWGGDAIGTGLLRDGAVYSPSSNTWTSLPTAGTPSLREHATAVWTGSSMLIWGGAGPAGQLNDGTAYTPVTHTWMALPIAGAPSPRDTQIAVWTGKQMLIWGGEFGIIGAPLLLGDGAAYTPPPAPVPHDARYFPQTGYRIDNATIWNYFQRRGGVTTFGYPTSRTFLFQGFTVQFFQRRIVQLDQQGHARLLNLLDPSLLNYTQFNGSTFPGVESALVATAPPPTDQPAVLAWVQQHAPDGVAGAPVNFDATFLGTVSAQTAFPNGGDASLLPGIDLEMWGIPTSQTMMDVNNHHFIYLRWQRGIMMYDASCSCTQGVLLADYLKDILTSQNLPADLAQEAANSPFLDQYDPGAPNWVHNPSLLPNTDLTNAFTPE